MEEIAKEFGLCLIYMLPIVCIAAFFVSCIHADGILYNVMQAYLAGLSG